MCCCVGSLLSGAIHGDERAGPTAAIELVRYLCERYGVDGEVRDD